MSTSAKSKPDNRAKTIPRNWTKEEVDILMKYHGVESASELSERLGRSESSIVSKAYKLRKQGHTLEKVYVPGKTGVRMTTAQYDQRLLDRHEGTILRLGDFTGIMKHTEHQCQKCGYEWTPCPNKLVNGPGTGCPSCAGQVPMTEEEYYQRILEKTGGTVRALSYPKQKSFTVNGVCTKALGDYECITCGHQWQSTFTNVLYQGTRCKKCTRTGNLETGVPVMLYYICIDEYYYKIGLTNKTIELRFYGDTVPIREVWSHVFEDGREAQELETLIKREFKDAFCSADLDVLKAGNTEMCTFDFLGLDNNLTW